jgi:hypothetical protein
MVKTFPALLLLVLWLAAPAAGAADVKPEFRVSPQVTVSVPDKAIEKSFRIAADLVAEMRRIAYENYKRDGWLAVSMGRNGPQAGYDIRDFRFGPKCAVYLWGDDRTLATEMGKRIFFDQHDPDGRLTWDPTGQCGIHIAHVAKHFSDYLRYSEQDKFIQDNWARQLKIVKWSLSKYDRNDDGLIENGQQVPDYLWTYLVGEPMNSVRLPKTQDDVVVVPTMDVCEWLQLLAAYGAANRLPDADWLKAKAGQMQKAIETLAYDRDAGYYFLLRRTAENKWYHSGGGINEASRETDVTPYYAAFISGNDSRGRKVAEYARGVLLDYNIFPMPLMYPSYYWACPNYSPHGFVPGGCWEESYYNCVRAWLKYRMFDAVDAAIKRRSDAHVRDGQCSEWYGVDGSIQGRDQYGISGAAHVSAVIEGLFGIAPTRFGFGEVDIWPAIPAAWADQPATIRVTLPGSGFLQYTYLFSKQAKTVTLTIETDRQRQGHFRIPVPGGCNSVFWNGERLLCDVAYAAGHEQDVVYLDKPFQKATIRIQMN